MKIEQITAEKELNGLLAIDGKLKIQYIIVPSLFWGSGLLATAKTKLEEADCRKKQAGLQSVGIKSSNLPSPKPNSDSNHVQKTATVIR